MSETLPNSIGFTISAPINEFACNLLLPKHFLHKNTKFKYRSPNFRK